MRKPNPSTVAPQFPWLRRAVVGGTIAIIFLLVAAPAAFAQNREGAKVLTVRGWGTVQVRPDVALLAFRATSAAPSAQEAHRAHRGKVAALIAALRKVLPPAVVLSEGRLAFLGPQAGRVRCTSLVEIEIPGVDTVPLEDLGQRLAIIIDTALQAGADALIDPALTTEGPPGPVRFSVSDNAGAHRKAFEAAIADARARAKTIADGAGLKLGAIQALEEIVPRTATVTTMRLEGDNSGTFEMTVQVSLSLDLE